MLKDLEILNGDMPLKFNPLNTIYTVNVEADVETLEFNYNIDSNDEIFVFGNNLDYGENEVVITVYNDDDAMSYYLNVYRENTILASANIKGQVLEVQDEVPSYVIAAISSVCFLTILIFFVILFKKSKKY